MQGLVNATTVAIALAFIVPGYIMATVRSLFLTGRQTAKVEGQVLEALTLSALNLAICYPIAAPLIDGVGLSSWGAHLPWVLIFLVVPAALGAVTGVAAQRNWVGRMGQRFGLSPVHAMPTAWDWKFGLREEVWTLVTLKDGTVFAGYCGARSFMSSDPSERDLYVQEVFELDANKTWNPKGSGLYVAHGQISTIEFWPVSRGDTENGKGKAGQRPEGLPAESAASNELASAA
jgi:hypothetical protein